MFDNINDNVFNSKDRSIIAELRLDIKVKYLEAIMKQWWNENLNAIEQQRKEDKELKNPLLTIQDVCERFNICKGTLHNWKNRGLIVGKKVGKNRYFTEDEIRAALNKYGWGK